MVTLLVKYVQKISYVIKPPAQTFVIATKHRSSCLEVPFKKATASNFTKCETMAQVLSSEFCKILKSYF